MAKKKSSNLFWWILAILIVAVGVFVFSQDQGPEIDYSQYAFTDDEIVNANATHTITEYSDFQCPFCAQTAPVLRSVKNEYSVNVDYKHFPLTAIHPYAQLAAEASECARDQDRFWAYHDVLFDNQDFLSKPFLIKHAEGLGMDRDMFKSCLDNRDKQVIVANDVLEGKRLNVQGTPTIYIDGELVNYRSYAQFAGHFYDAEQ